MAGKPPFPNTTLQWAKKELSPICEGIVMVARSQLGYEGRRTEEKIKQKVLQTVVMGGNVVDPLNPEKSINSSPATEAIQRAKVVSAGIQAFAKLLAQGVVPGSGGFTINEHGEKVYGKQMPIEKTVITNLMKTAEQISKGVAMAAPFPLPIITQLGKFVLSNPKAELPIPPQLRIGQLDQVIRNVLGVAATQITGNRMIDSDKLKLRDINHVEVEMPKEAVPIDTSLSKEEAEFLLKAARSVDHENAESALFGESTADKKVTYMHGEKKTSGELGNQKLDDIKNVDLGAVGDSQPIEPSMTKHDAQFLVKAAKSVEDNNAERVIFGEQEMEKVAVNDSDKPVVYRPTVPKDYQLSLDGSRHSLSRSNESKVPATRIGRLATFGSLAFGLLGGAAAEVTRRTVGMRKVVENGPKNPFLSEANADRIVATLCRVRGAALKLGQMLSIQDNSTVPQPLLEVFERVRQSADFMPLKQVRQQMRDAFGDDWRDKFAEFEERPFACASIGQVHKAKLKDGREVAVKIQYPGVAEGIDSDIDNLVSVLSVGGLFPKGMHLDSFVKVARRELKQECDYEREARAMRKFRELIGDWKDVYIPEVIDELSSSRVLTTQLISGKPVDECINEPQIVRDYISRVFIELCLNEIFVWRFMQTDPNWSNFFLGKHPETGEPCMILLDFGASRAYGKKFVDIYMNIIKAAYDSDEKKIIEYSREIGFLTGYESAVMERAHAESVMIMGETLASNHPYDFAHQNVTARIQKLIPVMLEHRLTSPPEEIYSLHRKLSGCYLLAAKLKATVSCGGLFHEINKNYVYGDDGKDIDIDNVAK